MLTYFSKETSVFSQPLKGVISQDSSYYMFITWYEMPHLYPFSSILLFCHLASCFKNSLDPILVYQLEIAVSILRHIASTSSLTFILKKLAFILKWPDST
jgi:hypothetical protein